MIPPQAWIKGTESELSDSEVLTLPDGFEPATPKSLAWPRATGLSEDSLYDTLKRHGLAECKPSSIAEC